MATVKKISKKPSKSRGSTYEPKEKFIDSFEYIVKISTTGAG